MAMVEEIIEAAGLMRFSRIRDTFQGWRDAYMEDRIFKAIIDYYLLQVAPAAIENDENNNITFGYDKKDRIRNRLVYEAVMEVFEGSSIKMDFRIWMGIFQEEFPWMIEFKPAATGASAANVAGASQSEAEVGAIGSANVANGSNFGLVMEAVCSDTGRRLSVSISSPAPSWFF